MRYMMGIWWKEDLSLSTPRSTNRVSFDGDSSAISKAWPLMWRMGQDWHCLQVCSSGGAYSLHFMTESTRMTYHTFLKARFIMVREGTEPVYFWAQDECYEPVELLKTGRMVPANRFRPERSIVGATSMKQLAAIGEIVWV